MTTSLGSRPSDGRNHFPPVSRNYKAWKKGSLVSTTWVYYMAAKRDDISKVYFRFEMSVDVKKSML